MGQQGSRPLGVNKTPDRMLQEARRKARQEAQDARDAREAQEAQEAQEARRVEAREAMFQEARQKARQEAMLQEARRQEAQDAREAQEAPESKRQKTPSPAFKTPGGSRGRGNNKKRGKRKIGDDMHEELKQDHNVKKTLKFDRLVNSPSSPGSPGSPDFYRLRFT